MTKLLGGDLSFWQGLWDWQECAEHWKFAFIRAGSIDNTTGECYEDFLFKENAEEAPNHMPVGFYWYFRPNWSPTKQAEYFSNLIFPESWLLPPVIDVENNGGLPPSTYADKIKVFLDVMEQEIGYKCLIYTSQSKWAQVEPRPYWPLYDLWVAHYTLQDEPLMPEGWVKYMFWQWTSQGLAEDYGGLGSSTYVDLNYFNGDESDLNAYIGIPTTPDKVIVVTAHNALVREYPRQGEFLRVEPRGAVLGVTGEDKDEKGMTWYDLNGTGWVRSDWVDVAE